MKVSLFIACLTDTFYPRTGIAVVKVLEHLGCEVEFPTDQTCCGQPFWNNGFKREARDLAETWLRAFERSDYIVSPSGSCTAMVRDYYHELFAGDHAHEHLAQRLIPKTYEFVEFLVNVLNVDLRQYNVTWDGSATYHYSCHLRGIGMSNEAEQVIDQIDGIDYRPLEKKDQCCGFGGTFATKFPEVSGTMVRDKVSCIAKTKADTVISNDAGCTLNIAGACRRESVDVQFKSLAEVIAEAMGLMDGGEGARRDRGER